MTIEEIVRTYFQSHPRRDHVAIEQVVSPDFHFTSPLDNRIDRRTYFERCWPAGEMMASIDLQLIVAEGEHVFVTYELTMKDGRRSRNTELLTVRGGQVGDVEVYFGWNIPHEARAGSYVNRQGATHDAR